MQFKHPEILYALFLLLIPIIVHLFQLRRFKKVAFTNVEFLKEVELQTRKSSRLKKLLILFSRLLLFAAMIFAFAQPFISKEKNTLPINNYVYLDNSFSMQAKGKDGELLKRASQDIIENTSALDKIHLFTNNEVYKNLSAKDIKNTLLSIDYYPVKRELQSILLSIKSGIKDNNSLNNIVLVSDFQLVNQINATHIDSVNNFFITKLAPLSSANISIDSVYISNQNNESLTIKTLIKSYGKSEKNISISLYNDKALSGKSSVEFDENANAEVEFTVPNTTIFNGKLQIDDNYLDFDNSLFFTIQKPARINVTAIGEDNAFLSKIYSKDEFNFISTGITNFDYNTIEDQHLIVLNELQNIPNSFITSLKEFVSKNGSLVIIPPINADLELYSKILKNLANGNLTNVSQAVLSITTINFSHPLLRGVFEKRIENFQYPTVKSSYKSNFRNASSLLDFENGDPFVSQIKIDKGSMYWFSSSLGVKNSNFKSSPLIVPIFYNFGLYSFKPSQLYYTIGNINTIEIAAQLKKDEVLHLTNTTEDFIPLQQISAKKVTLTTESNPAKSGFIEVQSNKQALKNIAFNYDRKESDLSSVVIKDYINEASNVTHIDSVGKAFTALSDNYKTTNLWQHFLLLALLFLVTEILFLKFLRS